MHFHDDCFEEITGGKYHQALMIMRDEKVRLEGDIKNANRKQKLPWDFKL